MADFTGITADRAEEILGMSVVSVSLNEDGHIIFTRGNGETIDGGDFTTIVGDILASQVETVLADTLPDAIAGDVINKGNVSGALTIPELNNDTIVNAMVTVTMTGNVTLNVSAMPSSPKTNSQWVLRLKQDGTGGRSFTTTGFLKSVGVLPITQTPNALDLIVFLYDGTNWLVGLMGSDFKA